MLNFVTPFQDVLNTIKEHAFHGTGLPLFLHLEEHCTERGRERLVFQVGEALGSLLVGEDFQDIPSPSQMEGKIVLSGTTKM